MFIVCLFTVCVYNVSPPCQLLLPAASRKRAPVRALLCGFGARGRSSCISVKSIILAILMVCSGMCPFIRIHCQDSCNDICYRYLFDLVEEEEEEEAARWVIWIGGLR